VTSSEVIDEEELMGTLDTIHSQGDGGTGTVYGNTRGSQFLTRDASQPDDTQEENKPDTRKETISNNQTPLEA